MGEGLYCTSLHITFLFILNSLICPLTVLVIGSFLMYMNFRVFNNILKLIEASITYPNGFYM